jgi:NAD+ kinase
MKSIYLCINPDKADASHIAEEIKSVASKSEVTVVDTPQDSDVVISIGGDGTFLHASHLAIEYDKVVAGINLGRYGFLPTFEPTHIDELIADIINERNIYERSLVDVKSGDTHTLVVNEVVVERRRVDRAIRLDLELTNTQTQSSSRSTFVCDGVIVATPIGSTAYSSSVGGPVLSQSARLMSIAFAALHHPKIAPFVVGEDSELRVRVQDESILSCDGKCIMDLEAQAEIFITISPKILRVCERKVGLIERLVAAVE